MQEIIKNLSKSPITPIKMDLDSKFTFNCHKGVECFTSCCGKIDVFLTPYDIVRMKNRLNMTSTEFIALYTVVSELQKTKLPLLMLKMTPEGKCPFVTEEGCSIYSDRPVVCRYYPIGFGLLRSREVGGGDFFFPIKEDFCKGYNEDKEWTVRQWREEQEINVFDDINKFWFDIILQKKLRAPDVVPDDRSFRLFIFASYDVDSFRNFVFESDFLKKFDVPKDILEEIKEDETELLKFAHRWLKGVLFGDQEFKRKA